VDSAHLRSFTTSLISFPLLTVGTGQDLNARPFIKAWSLPFAAQTLEAEIKMEKPRTFGKNRKRKVKSELTPDSRVIYSSFFFRGEFAYFCENWCEEILAINCHGQGIEQKERSGEMQKPKVARVLTLLNP
jgi:hypothetical protein